MVVRYIPDNLRERDYVLTVLDAYPELHPFIAEVAETAREIFPSVVIKLEPHRYEDDDPLLHMMIEVTQDWSEYRPACDHFVRVVGKRPDYDRDLICAMPTWVGPMETYVPPPAAAWRKLLSTAQALRDSGAAVTPPLLDSDSTEPGEE